MSTLSNSPAQSFMKQTVEEAAENYHNNIYPTPGNWIPADAQTQKERQTSIETAFEKGAAWQREQGIDWISINEKGLPPCTIFGSYHEDSVEVLVTDGEKIEKSHYHLSTTLLGWYGISFLPTHYAYFNLPKNR